MIFAHIRLTKVPRFKEYVTFLNHIANPSPLLRDRGIFQALHCSSGDWPIRPKGLWGALTLLHNELERGG